VTARLATAIVQILSVGFGLAGAVYWFKAARVSIPIGQYKARPEFEKIGRWNAWAAVWTAVSVLLQAASVALQAVSVWLGQA
jgi:hypothetical protein